MIFQNRQEAGIKLAHELEMYKDREDVVVLGIPRGGVVTAYEVAKELNCPLDVTIARKIGAPSNPEFALGAVGEKGEVVLNPDVACEIKLGDPYIKEEAGRQREEIKRRLEMFREGGKGIDFKNKIVIIVDDGIATGSTMQAAVKSVREDKPSKIVVAIPVAPPQSIEELEQEADEVVCLHQDPYFMAVGQFYSEFSQTEDEEVIEILKKATLLH